MVGGTGLEPVTSSASRKRSSSELTTQQKGILQILRLFVNKSWLVMDSFRKMKQTGDPFRWFPSLPDSCPRQCSADQGAPVRIRRLGPEPQDKTAEAQKSEKIAIKHPPISTSSPRRPQEEMGKEQGKFREIRGDEQRRSPR